MYLHFINWKITMRINEVKYKNYYEHFFISYNGIHLNRHNKIISFLNRFKNIFFGYWTFEWIRIKKNKLKKFIKKI